MPASDVLVKEHHEKQALAALEDHSHYVESIAQMANTQEVFACEAVFTTNGIKLIERGVTIDGGLRDRLVNHRLLKPIDHCLEAKDGINGESLARIASRLVSSSPVLKQLLDHGDELASCLQLLQGLQLPGQLMFKLSVMHSRMPWLLDHVITAALIAHSLAHQMHLSPHSVMDAVLAGLTHDLGELHTNPAILDRRHKMGNEELSNIDVHPITSYLIVRNILPDHPAVAVAVLQHHEKLDGSGYPNRLRGEAIGPLTRILSVAEAAASITLRDNDSERLSTWMRLSRQKHDRTILSLLHKRLQLDGADFQTEHSLEANEIDATIQLLQRWSEFSAELHNNPSAATAFLFERMADLKVVLLQFGLDPNHPDALHALAADENIGRELATAFDEVRRQITDVEREVLRRRDALAKTLLPADVELLDDWLVEIHSYHLVADPMERAPEIERRGNAAS